MILHDILQAWNDYVDKTIVVTITSAGVPSGQSEFNVNEKVKYDLKVTNGDSATGVQVDDVRLHVHSANVSGTTGTVFKLIVPPASVATAYPDATSTTALTAGTEQTVMFLETAALATLSAGETVTISGLEVIGKGAGSAVLESHVHATVKTSTLFPTDTTGKEGTKTLTVKT
jgi:hypothetical protein